MLKAAGQLWMYGIDPDWEAFYGQHKRERIKIPTYAFDRTRCWVNPVLPLQINASPGNITVDENILPQKNRDRKASIIERLKVIFENASGIEMELLSPETNVIETGFDSLLLTQVALNLKKEFGLPISFRQLNEKYGNLDLLAALLDEQLPKEEFQDK